MGTNNNTNTNTNKKKKKNNKKSFFRERAELEAIAIREYQQKKEQAVMDAIAADNDASSTRATQSRMFDAIQEMLESYGGGHELKKGWKKFASF
jgi:L-lactate utilization protein LutC